MAAADELRSVLAEYGLEGLFDQLNAAVVNDESLLQNPDALFRAIRTNPIYQERFKGNEERRKRGLPVLSETEYLATEKSYKQQLRNLGVSPGFYDTPADFARFIGNDVSPVELGNRIGNAYQQVANADPEVIRQMKQLYGVTEADLAEYFIDPERKRPQLDQMALQRQAQAAQIAAQAQTQAGIQLSSTEAESLARQGVSASDAATGFRTIQQQQDLLGGNITEDQLTQQEQIGAVFGTNAAAAQRVATRARRRQAEFAAGGTFAAGQRGVTGLTSASQ
jgi:hypothetical protein